MEKEKYKLIFRLKYFTPSGTFKTVAYVPTSLSNTLLGICKKMDIEIERLKVRNPFFRSSIRVYCTKEQYVELYKEMCNMHKGLKMISPYKP